MPAISERHAATRPWPHRLPKRLRVAVSAARELAQPVKLPARVRLRVAAEQEAAEKLIGLMQVLAIATFSVLYAIARLTNPPSAMIVAPIPAVLGIYAVLTAGRLWLAWRRSLPRGLVMASVVIDIAVLMALIWSFHLGSPAPPTIYLKSSTLMYVFILIALRALRLEPLFVLLAGATAVTFWGVLVAYGFLASGKSLLITHSFVQYATTPAELVGAEFDKFVTIATVSAILALVVTRGRRLLVETARGELALTDFSRFLAPEIASRLRAAETEVMVGMAERRDVAILTTDLRGFTALSHRLQPEELLRLIAEYQAAMVPAIQANGGSIDKYLGDGILASFGAVQPSPRYAADAMRALEDVLDAADAWSLHARASGLPAVRVGAAVTTGEALFGTIGHTSRLEYTVIGDPVNLAAKLEKHTKEEHVPALASADAFARAQAQGYSPRRHTRLLPARRIVGVAEGIDLVAFTALRGPAAAPLGQSSGGHSGSFYAATSLAIGFGTITRPSSTHAKTLGTSSCDYPNVSRP